MPRRLLQIFGLVQDGRSELMERQALGLGATPTGPEAPAIAPQIPPRRVRPAPSQRVLQEQVASKLLHGWLQNRHQTLFPLALNLRNLPPPRRLLLARWMAATAAMTGAAPPDAALVSVGGGDAEKAALAEAVSPLPGLLLDIRQAELGPHAYTAALLAAAPGRVGQAWLDYLAAALGLPLDVISDLRRRGGRRLSRAAR